jgi:N-glycosylase/DNA lyase
METGTISLTSLSGGFDLQSTVESGQSYLWRRADGEMYADPAARRGDCWYETVVPPGAGRTEHAVVRVRQVEDRLEWESTVDARSLVWRLLRLDDDLEAVRAAAPDDPLVERAFERFAGMRLVRDPPFPALVSFICSAQMRVGRIHDMQVALAREFGATVDLDGRSYHTFPTPDRLAAATETELRDLGLGYRAPYVERTAAMVADGDAHPAEARDRDYEAARDYLTQFVGVGDKVADCVLLFSLDFLEAVPLDTWIQTAIAEHYPECDRGNYAETSRAIRERLGGEYAGYAQTYLFHHLRTRDA